MTMPEMHPREAIVMEAERELREFLCQSEPFRYVDCFGAYGCLLLASAIAEGGLTCHDLPPKTHVLCDFFLDLRQRHALTTGEIIFLIAGQLASSAEYLVWWERTTSLPSLEV